MPDTVHALIVATDGTITDLHLHTTNQRQQAQLEADFGDTLEIVHWGCSPDGGDVMVFAARHSTGQPLNAYAGIAVALLDQTPSVIGARGPALFAGFTPSGRLTDLSPDAVNAIRACAPETPSVPPGATSARP